jgi:hypothetical protein
MPFHVEEAGGVGRVLEQELVSVFASALAPYAVWVVFRRFFTGSYRSEDITPPSTQSTPRSRMRSAIPRRCAPLRLETSRCTGNRW